MKKDKQKILYLISEDWYFCSHRLPLAVAAKQAGYDVAVATRIQAHGNVISKAGIRAIPLRLRRRGKNPISELLSLLQILYIYMSERPDIVHHVAMKPVLYGTIAALATGVPLIVNAFSGLGYIFISDKFGVKFLRTIIKKAFRLLLNGRRRVVILQNLDDKEMLVNAKVLDEEQVIIIGSSGVNLDLFTPHPEPSTALTTIVLASRMLWDKGVGEFVEAARCLKQQGIKARFQLAGDTDLDNPSFIPREQLEEWHRNGVVEWLKHVDDMPQLFRQSHIVCLPSYREGCPKVLLEAGASGRSIIATDVPGCREIVQNGQNGFLVPAKNAESLAEAIRKLIENPHLREEMGRRSRELVERRFALNKVISETLEVYGHVLFDESGELVRKRLHGVSKV